MSSKISKDELKVEDKYQKMTPHEHILSLPDTYIGSITTDQLELWVVDSNEKMDKKLITYVPGLYKIYDEILVNARDHAIRESACKTIKVNINQENGEISVFNDGPGIEVEIHKTHKIYVPELIFGNVLTSSNYKQTGKTWGGKNGYGAKLTNIYSTQFCIETIDSKNSKKYIQTFHRNMLEKDKPIITDIKKGESSYTKITFTPDYKRFGLSGMTDDILSLFKKRVYDIAACTYQNVKVYLNDELIKINSFGDYIKLFCSNSKMMGAKMTYSEVNDRWRVGVVYVPGGDSGFTHMSHVNGIWTYSTIGGTHVSHATDQVIKGLMTYIKEKHKDVASKIKPQYLKENMAVFVDCVVEDPSFSSQTKECLTTKVSDFKKRCDISDNFILSIAKSGIVDDAIQMAQFKDLTDLKKLNGKKSTKVRVEKHDPALWAGTKKSHLCRLIITEGDSAKTFALRGRKVIGQEKYGVFPIRGKMLNVREATHDQQQKNEEIKHIMQIMGLRFETVYTEKNLNKLNYGGLLILTDQDPDGSHIKGLVINFIHFYWPSLLKVNGFIQTMSTPLVKVFKKSDKNEKSPTIFYSLSEYDDWKKKQGVNLNKWYSKYYKGLASSDEKEQLEAFSDFNNKLMSYVWETESEKTVELETSKDKEETDDVSDENSESDKETETSKADEHTEIEDTTSKSYSAIILAFSKGHEDDRKRWLGKYDEKLILEPVNQMIPYSDFIDKDLIHFANYNIIRSVPRMTDGLKPSQRKILFTALERKLYEKSKAMKVMTLGSAVSERTNYLHGETSLQEAIVCMAQTYVGSNNLNLFYPAGDFGSRRMGGEDHGAPRYIHTYLSKLTSLIFRQEDEPIFAKVLEDGVYYEPKTYAPIIPTVLINGAHGVGTGYSTHVPCYNPKDIINNILRLMNDQEPNDMIPWYRGFSGKILARDEYSNVAYGKYKIIDENTVKISELPIGKWTVDYEKYLQTLEVDTGTSRKKDDKPSRVKENLQCLKEYINESLPDSVNFTLKFNGNILQQLIKAGTLENRLKLTESKCCSTSNMHLFNAKGVITKYDNVCDIMNDYYDFRLEMYEIRKKHHTRILKNELDINKYKIKFLEDVIKRVIVIEKRKKSDVIKDLIKNGYPRLSKDITAVEPPADVDDDEDDSHTPQTETKIVYKKYNYITDLQLFSLTEDKLAELRNQRDMKQAEYEKYCATLSKDIWREELLELSNAYDKWIDEMDEQNSKSDKSDKKKLSKKSTVKKTK